MASRAKGPAVVIGVGPGLGLSLVRQYAGEGRPTAFISRRADAVSDYATTLKAEGLDVLGLVGDAADPESLSGAIKAARAAHGDPDVLVYNAAIVEPSRFVTRSGIETAKYASGPGWSARGAPLDFDALIEGFRANVAGALLAAQQVAPAMIERQCGTILLTGGVLAFGPWIEWGAVSLGKAALRSLGQSLHLELSPFGVNVAVVAIHGTMEPGTAYDPACVAALYGELPNRPVTDWTVDVHFRASDDDGSDPDL